MPARMTDRPEPIQTTGIQGRAPDLTALFTATFTASEGPGEGALIGGLVRDLLATTPEPDLRVFATECDGVLAAAAIFSRLHYPQDGACVFLLSPLAVATRHQRLGLGQRLLAFALAALRAEGVDVALTYGDPAWYAKSGFRPLSPDHAQPPLPLSMPQGWIGQSLDGGPLRRLAGPSTCAPALNHPAFW